MSKPGSRGELLQGTLDMPLLRTLLFGPAHGHQIARHIQTSTEDVLQIEHGSLYPALHRLERKGWIAARWEAAGKDLKREFKYYRLTPVGRRQLTAEESKWKQLTQAIARVMWPAAEGPARVPVCGRMNLVYGVREGRSATYDGAVVLLAIVALAATWIPAQQAARVDPLVAIRYE